MNTKSKVRPRSKARMSPCTPLHRCTALVRLAPSHGQHLRREIQPDARTPVERDRDELVPGFAPQLQHTPALPVGLAR